MSVIQKVKDAIIAESGQPAWDEILENHDDELARLVYDGDVATFLSKVSLSDTGMTQPQIDAIVLADPSPPTQPDDAEPVFFYFPVWAEESGNLTANNTQWSFGNGAVGAMGIPMAECEVVALSLNALNFGTSAEVRLRRNNIEVDSEVFTSNNQYVELGTPISFSQSDLLGFQTGSVVGTTRNVRITAWCRSLISSPVIKGDQGEPGPAGQDGIGAITTARIPIATGFNLNTSSYSTPTLDTPTFDTVGLSITSNVITVPAGTYDVRLVCNTTSTVQRPNQEVQLLVNGVSYGSEYSEGYIRSGSGHNESKISYSDLVVLGSAGTFEFQTRQIAAAGTVNTDAGSKILLKKLE